MIDFNLHEGEDLINDATSYVLQQIEILFDTTPGDLLGDLDYGTRYENYLYELKLSEDQLKRAIENDLAEIDLCGYEPNVQVFLSQGTERDIALIEINLVSPSGNTIKKAYKIV